MLRSRNPKLLWIACLSVSTGCLSTLPPKDLAPVGSVERAAATDLSGSYCFSDPEESVRGFERDLSDLSWLPLDRAEEGTLIEVRHDGDSIGFSFVDAEGEPLTAHTNLGEAASVENGVITVDRRASSRGARMGVGRSREESYAFRMADGRLVLGTLSAERGMAFLVVPFRERYEIVVELAPAIDGGCH